MSGGFGVVDFMKLATLHGALSATGHTVDGDAIFRKKLIEIDVLCNKDSRLLSEVISPSVVKFTQSLFMLPDKAMRCLRLIFFLTNSYKVVLRIIYSFFLLYYF